jgi:hypothetical protein
LSIIPHKVDPLVPHSPISVIPAQGEEDYGEFIANYEEGFTFRDADRG